MSILRGVFHDARAAIGVMCFPLTGGGLNPVDIGELARGVPRLAEDVAIWGLGAVERLCATGNNNAKDDAGLGEAWAVLRRSVAARHPLIARTARFGATALRSVK